MRIFSGCPEGCAVMRCRSAFKGRLRHAGDHWQGRLLIRPQGSGKRCLVRRCVVRRGPRSVPFHPLTRRAAYRVATRRSTDRRSSDAGRASLPAPSRDTSMANKMLIDSTHPEETRVVVLRGNRVEEFDFESASRRQLRGNIYLAKVTRVEPSLQAAFVDYGGNRHGFLAFSEIHPDYYQIPVADRQALIAEEERAHRDAEDEADRRAGMRRRQPAHRSGRRNETVQGDVTEAQTGDSAEEHFEGAHVDQAHDDEAHVDDAHGENDDATDIETLGGAENAAHDH